MSLRSVAAGLLLALLAFHSSGASLACATDDHAPAGTMAWMQGAEAAPMEMDGLHAGDESMQGERCDHPPSPRDCQSMAPCGVTFFVSASIDDEAETDDHAGVTPANVLAPLSISLRPEPPPPRA